MKYQWLPIPASGIAKIKPPSGYILYPDPSGRFYTFVAESASVPIVPKNIPTGGGWYTAKGAPTTKSSSSKTTTTTTPNGGTTTTTTSGSSGNSNTPSWVTGGSSSTGSASIKYPSSKEIYNALVKSGANAGEAQVLANKIGGKSISITTDSSGNISTSGADELVATIEAEGGPALLAVTLGQIPGFSVGEWLSGTKAQGSLAKGLVEALNTASKNFSGDLSKLSTTGQNYGAGLTIAQQQNKEVLDQAVNIAGGMINAYTTAQQTGAQKISAYETLYNKLDSLNLGSLAGEVQNWVFSKGITNGNELMQLVRKTPQYKQMFAGLVGPNGQWAQAAKNGTKPLTEAEYLTLTNSYLSTAQAAGLPQGFLTQKEMGELVANGVNAAEFSRRVADGYQAVASLPPAVQAQFEQQHGITKGGLVAYFLNPKTGEAALERQALAANLSNTATNVGLSGFTPKESTDLAEMVRMATSGTGAGALQDPYLNPLAKATEALTMASKDQPLTRSLPGQAAPTVDTQTLIGSQIAGYEGTNQAAAQVELQRAEQTKAAPFEKGGGYTETAKGVTGIGTART